MPSSKIETTDLSALSEVMGVYGDPVLALSDSKIDDTTDDTIAGIVADHATMRRVLQLLVVAGHIDLPLLEKSFALARAME